MTVLVSVVKQMIADGRDVSAVACASTGDTSAALAAYAAAAGIPAVSRPAAGTRLAGAARAAAGKWRAGPRARHRLRRLHGNRSAPGGRRRRLPRQLDEQPSPSKVRTFWSIVQQFDWEVRDVVVLPGGNLGNVSAIAAGFDMMLELGVIAKRPRMVVQQRQVNPLYTAYEWNWRMQANEGQASVAWAIQIGNPVWIDEAIRALQRFDGIVEQASESELAEAAARADRAGMFNCPHTAVALAALEKIASRGEIKRWDRVMSSSTPNVKLRVQTAYHTNALTGVTPRHANPPVELPTTTTPCDAQSRKSPRRRHRGPSSGKVEAGRAARSLEVRRSISSRRCGHRTRRRAHLEASWAARRCRLRARRRRGLLPSSRAPTQPHRVRRRIEAADRLPTFLRRHRDVARGLIPAGPARRRLLATIDTAAREFRELCVAIGVLGHLAPAQQPPGVAR